MGGQILRRLEPGRVRAHLPFSPQVLSSPLFRWHDSVGSPWRPVPTTRHRP
jgi:hypothetical protein